MMQRPWDCAQPDEWLPQSLRLCWGGGGDSGGGGWSDSGASTGGGDWGSAGSYDASSFDAGGIGAWGGTAYDASVFGQSAGGAGDWGSFGDTNYSGFNAPNAIFTDIAGPNPGVTTGGGDWGSAGVSSFAGTGGGPGGAMLSAAQGAAMGAGGGFWGGGDSGGGYYGGGGGGGGGGYTGGGGGQQGGGGSFGSFGSGTLGGSNAYAAAPTGPSGSNFADTAGGGSLSGGGGKGGSEAAPDAGPDAGPDADPDAAPSTQSTIAGGRETDFGAPTQPEAQPEAEPQAAPEVSSTIAGGRETNFDYGPRAAQSEPEAQPSAFGPQSVIPGGRETNFDYGPSQSYQQASQQLSALTQSALAPQQDTFDSRFGFDTSGAGAEVSSSIPGGRETNFDYGPSQAYQQAAQQLSELTQSGLDPTNWGAVFEGTTPPAEVTAPAIETSIPGGRETNFDYGPFGGFDSQAYQDASQQLSALTQSALAPPTGMDLAGDMRTETGAINPNSTFQLGWEPANAYQPTDVSPSLAYQLGIQNLTVNPGLPTQPVFGVTGMNYNTLTHDTDPAAQQPANVELVPADQAPPPPNLTTPPPQEAQPQAPQEAQQAQPQETQQTQPQQTEQTQPQQTEQAQPQQTEQAQPQETQQAPPPSLIEQAQQPPPQEAQPVQPPGLTMLPPPTLTPPVQPTEAPQQPPGQPGAEPQEHDDAPEPQDTSQPPQDPNAPRPPANVPGQVTGARGTYTNDRMDNPRTNTNYRDSGRTDYPQGRPGINFRTARQAGVEPLFRTEDINVRDVDARLVENINRALRAMEQRTGIPANSLVATSGWRPAHRGEAYEHGQDERTSQESVYTRYNPNGRNIGPAAQPGRSNHGPGRALDFAASPARTWLRDHAREFGLETLGRNFDLPHIQLQRGEGGQRPSAQEQAEQRALDAQNRQAAIDSGRLVPGGRGNQQAGVPMPRARPSDAPQPEVAQPRPPADIPPPAPPVTNLPPADRPPADIPAPTLTPPRAGRADPVMQARQAQDILKQSTAHLNTKSGEAEFAAASVVGAKAMAAAGIPLAMARSLMTQGAYAGAKTAGYDVNSFPMGGVYKSKIDAGIEAALQGYQPAKPGEVQGPPSPFAPGKQGAAPFGQQFAGLSQSVGPAPIDPTGRTGREGDVGGRQPVAPWNIPTLNQLSPLIRSMDPNPRYSGGLLHLAAGGRDVGAPPAIQGFPGRDYGEGEIIGNPNLMIEDWGFGTSPPAPPRGLQDPNNPDRPFMITPPFSPDLPGGPYADRYLAKGGHVAKDEPVVVGEEGPETFVPDTAGTVVPHMPQPGGKNLDRWPKGPAVDWPGQYGGVEREIWRQTRAAQNPVPSLMDLIDSGRLPLNAANWQRMMNDPSLIALGRSGMEDRRGEPPLDPNAPPDREAYWRGVEENKVGDPLSPMAQALGIGSIRRPMRIGRQIY